jgi:acrylyl-CoA reductase (NADPH)
MDFPATVAPFILRGIALIGIDSGYAPMPDRIEAWKLIGAALDPAAIESMAPAAITLEDSIDASHELLEGRILGRVVVRLR